MVVVCLIAELDGNQDVMGSTQANPKSFTSLPAMISFVGCQLTLK